MRLNVKPLAGITETLPLSHIRADEEKMTEEYKILLTSALTILGGIVVFASGQIFVKFIVEPLHEQSKLIGEIAESLIYYANASAAIVGLYAQHIQELNKDSGLDETLRKIQIERYQELIKRDLEKSDESSKVLRRHASQLLSRTHSIPLYWLWTIFGRPSYANIVLASRELIGLSNSKEKSDTKRATEIAKRLKITVILRHLGVK